MPPAFSQNDSGSTKSTGTTPVGVTIAYRRQQDGFSPALERSNKKSPSLAAAVNLKKPQSSIQVLVEGMTLYIACLILPSVLGYVTYLYRVAYRATDDAALPVRDSDTPSTLVWAQTTATFYYERAASYVCPTIVEPGSYARMICPTSVITATTHAAVLYSPDTDWSDVSVITALSLAIALFRVCLVHWLVPHDDDDTNNTSWQAMVRCKSAHLLGSDYSPLPLPRKRQQELDTVSRQSDSDFVVDGLGFDNDSECDNPSSNAADLQFNDNVDDAMGTRLYSAPRFATAVFRLVYCATAAALAYSSFCTANFWPWFVGGCGATEKCWDLNGGLSLGLDSDFDHRNLSLKRYFLLQASFHWHSGAFHLWSLAMLYKHPQHTPRRFLSLQTNSQSYGRSLMHHLLLLVLIGTAYVFSSLRRLAAIGMFAFDVSSCFLHSLQICINANETSWLRRRTTVWKVYFLLVIPTFVYARFLVWPLLWYSAAFESTNWLKQLENTLVPGSARILMYLIHALMFTLMIMTLIYFGRLTTHPHLSRIIRRKKKMN
jgi:hypothetical protein